MQRAAEWREPHDVEATSPKSQPRSRRAARPPRPRRGRPEGGTWRYSVLRSGARPHHDGDLKGAEPSEARRELRATAESTTDRPNRASLRTGNPSSSAWTNHPGVEERRSRDPTPRSGTLRLSTSRMDVGHPPRTGGAEHPQMFEGGVSPNCRRLPTCRGAACPGVRRPDVPKGSAANPFAFQPLTPRPASNSRETRVGRRSAKKLGARARWTRAEWSGPSPPREQPRRLPSNLVLSSQISPRVRRARAGSGRSAGP